MWGVNGKNHSRPMGYHWLVALFLLSAEIATSADHVIVDGSVEVYNSNWETYLNGINSKLSDTGFIVQYLHNISDDSGSIISSLSSFRSANHSDLAVISSFLTSQFGVGTTFDTVVQRLYDSFYNNRFVTDGNYVLQTVFPETMLYFQGHTNATVKLAVSDLGVQERLDRIIDYLSRSYHSYNVPLGFVTSFGHIPVGDPSTSTKRYYNQLQALYQAYINNYPTVSGNAYDVFFDELYWQYGDWKWNYLDTYLRLNRNLLLGERAETNNFVSMISNIDKKFAPYERVYYKVYNESYYDQYSTRPSREMISNFVYSAVQGNSTNLAILKQLVSPSEISALFSQSGSSNAVMMAADFLSSQGLVTTNGVYQSEYSVPTNVDALADIDTNGWGNSSYSAYSEAFDPESVSNTVSRFDFETFFSESLDGAIESIDVSDVGDYVLEFGNLTLGDWFSYTIPSITIQHNETWLSFVDKFFLGIKAFATCGFFLLLWRHLSEVT